MPAFTTSAKTDETVVVVVVVVTGPVGAGKTTTSIALTDALIAHRVPNALIDMDYLSWAWPAPHDDRFNSRLGYRNLAFVATTYREHGVRVMVMAGVVEEEEDRDRVVAAIPGARVVIVRLRVPLDLIAERLRERDSGDDLAWSLNRADRKSVV